MRIVYAINAMVTKFAANLLFTAQLGNIFAILFNPNSPYLSVMFLFFFYIDFFFSNPSDLISSFQIQVLQVFFHQFYFFIKLLKSLGRRFLKTCENSKLTNTT
jgi:hypothetical protein